MSARRPEEQPLDGQGEPLPRWAKVEGQWVWRNNLFLYKPRDGQKTGAVAITMTLRRADGNVAPGVDAIRLAEQLKVSVTQLFAHNMAGTLFVAAHRDAPQYGGVSAVTYRFRIGMVQAYRTFEEGIPTSRA
ncbi:MAG TPA: hypothetical protein VKY24_00845 [Reyranella sp.]|nr:hypothetical protein [Reyranella sp.]